MSFRLVSKSVILNDLERRNGRYFALFSRNYEVGWMGVGAGVYVYDVVVKKFTFVISSPDELLVLNVTDFFLQRLCL